MPARRHQVGALAALLLLCLHCPFYGTSVHLTQPAAGGLQTPLCLATQTWMPHGRSSVGDPLGTHASHPARGSHPGSWPLSPRTASLLSETKPHPLHLTEVHVTGPRIRPLGAHKTRSPGVPGEGTSHPPTCSSRRTLTASPYSPLRPWWPASTFQSLQTGLFLETAQRQTYGMCFSRVCLLF